MKLLYSEKGLFCTRTKLLNFKHTLSLRKLNKVSSRPVSNGLTFSSGTPVDIELVVFSLLLVNQESEQSVKNFGKHHPVKNAFYLTKNHTLFSIVDIIVTFF